MVMTVLHPVGEVGLVGLAELPQPDSTTANATHTGIRINIAGLQRWVSAPRNCPAVIRSPRPNHRCRDCGVGTTGCVDASSTGARRGSDLNPDVIALGRSHLALRSRPEPKAKRSGDLFGRAFQCAFTNLLTPNFRGNDYATLPRPGEHVRDIPNGSVDACVRGFSGVAGGNQASACKYCSPTIDRPGTWRVSGRAHAAVGTCGRVRDGLASACLLFISHLLPPSASSIAESLKATWSAAAFSSCAASALCT